MVVGNCNAKVNDTIIGKIVAESIVPDNGGTLVMITNNPWGEVPHYLRRNFGNHITGRGARKPAVSPKVRKFILQMPYKNKVSIDWLAPPKLVHWAKTWDEVIGILEVDYPNGAKVAVIPDATIQYFDVVSTLC